MTTWPRAMPALITPFTPDGVLDEDAHRHNVSTMSRRGAKGLVLAGSTGEGPYLEPGERATLTAAARDAVRDLTIVCGVHAESTRQAHQGVEEAASGGADAALVVTPTSLVRGRGAQVLHHYVAVADRASIPVLLYSVPRVTGWELPMDIAQELSQHPNIVGMKDSGGNSDRIPDLGSALVEGFIVFAGASRALAASARSGAWGAITASANYALTDVSLAARGDDQAQRRLNTLTSVIEPFGVPGTKHAAGATGMLAGTAREPLPGLDAASAADVEHTLEAAGLLSTQ